MDLFDVPLQHSSNLSVIKEANVKDGSHIKKCTNSNQVSKVLCSFKIVMGTDEEPGKINVIVNDENDLDFLKTEKLEYPMRTVAKIEKSIQENSNQMSNDENEINTNHTLLDRDVPPNPEKQANRSPDENTLKSNSSINKCDEKSVTREIYKKAFLSLDDFPKPKQCEELELSCTICNKRFSDKKSLSEHTLSDCGRKSFNCKVCNRYFLRNQGLKRHFCSQGLISCNICNKSFSYYFRLKEHMRSHTETKLFLCTICNKLFSSLTQLSIHNRTHTGEKPYSCSICNKTFSQRTHLTTHIRNKHEEKSFSCDICKKSFSVLRKLTIHMGIHNGNYRYSCSICNKHLSGSTALAMHMYSHTEKKPFVCAICNQSFLTKIQLRKHLGKYSIACL